MPTRRGRLTTSNPQTVAAAIAGALPALTSRMSLSRSQIIVQQWRAALTAASTQHVEMIGVDEASAVDGPAGDLTTDPGRSLAAVAVTVQNHGSDCAAMLVAETIDSPREAIDVSRQADLARHLADELASRMRERGVSFLQWARDAEAPGDAAATPSWPTLLGFSELATLQYLSLPLVDTPGRPAAASHPDRLLHVRSIDPDRQGQQEFVDLVDQTYHRSLDCPRFLAYRTAQQTVANYRLSSSFAPDGWFIVWGDAAPGRSASEPAGVLVMGLHGGGNPLHEAVAEVHYMGLTPGARGRGLGRRLLERAIDWATQRRCGQLILAVDVQNTPAVATYRRRGMRPILQETVWGRSIQNR